MNLLFLLLILSLRILSSVQQKASIKDINFTVQYLSGVTSVSRNEGHGFKSPY